MIRIAIVGDYDPGRPAHVATDNALEHAATQLSSEIEWQWLPTTPLLNKEKRESLMDFHGIWGSAGDPESSLGLVKAIEVARTSGIPYLGT